HLSARPEWVSGLGGRGGVFGAPAVRPAGASQSLCPGHPGPTRRRSDRIKIAKIANFCRITPGQPCPTVARTGVIGTPVASLYLYGIRRSVHRVSRGDGPSPRRLGLLRPTGCGPSPHVAPGGRT